MKLGTIIFLAAFFLLDLMLRKKFPGFYKRIQLPFNIIASIVVAVYCGFLICTVYDVLTSPVSDGDKVFFVIFIGSIVAVYAALITELWRRWLRERRIDVQSYDDVREALDNEKTF